MVKRTWYARLAASIRERPARIKRPECHFTPISGRRTIRNLLPYDSNFRFLDFEMLITKPDITYVPLAGLATCCLALMVNLAITYAPGGYLPDRGVPQGRQSNADAPFAPPPARQR
jgi:hypothetical protein